MVLDASPPPQRSALHRDAMSREVNAPGPRGKDAIWVPRGAVLTASPKDDLVRRVVRLNFCVTTSYPLS